MPPVKRDEGMCKTIENYLDKSFFTLQQPGSLITLGRMTEAIHESPLEERETLIQSIFKEV
jgi:hypothetical protein